MKRIGVFGGTFDPIHNIHIEIVIAARKQFKLDEIIVIPAKIPPHKANLVITKEADRFEMVRLASRDYPFLKVSDMELMREGLSYTSDTLCDLSGRYPDADLYLIVGGDSVRTLEKWYRPELIFQHAHILFACRTGDGKEEILEHIDKVLHPQYDSLRISEIAFKETEVSSTRIREAISKGKFERIRQDLNPEVFDYIRKKGLYVKKKEVCG